MAEITIEGHSRSSVVSPFDINKQLILCRFSTSMLRRKQYTIAKQIFGGSVQSPTNGLTFSWFMSRIYKTKTSLSWLFRIRE